MERVAFLIEKNNQRISCLLNPDDGQDSFTVERVSGATRDTQRSLTLTRLSDNPVIFSGRGDTRMTLKLLFDVTLAGSSLKTNDVRVLTSPIWQLAEYSSILGVSDELPRARFIWGQAWNIPVVVESIAERFERFTAEGYPQRSWMVIRLLRLTDEIPPADQPSLYAPQDIPESPELPASDLTWGVHELVGSGSGGESLWQIAYQNYGDPALWRLIAQANDIDNPVDLSAGTILRIPPLSVLRGNE